jgi:hypothetical protein
MRFLSLSRFLSSKSRSLNLNLFLSLLSLFFSLFFKSALRVYWMGLVMMTVSSASTQGELFALWTRLLVSTQSSIPFFQKVLVGGTFLHIDFYHPSQRHSFISTSSFYCATQPP